MSNYGCAVNGNLAAMVANPEDLIHGRDGSGVGDAMTSTKAVQSYRKPAPTGNRRPPGHQHEEEGPVE